MPTSRSWACGTRGVSMGSDITVPEAVIVRAARMRSKLMGNRTTDDQINAVASRPVFREPVALAYQEGWMDALIYLEGKRRGRK